jgi:hypothetical protein
VKSPLTCKVGCNKIDISLLGPEFASRYFPEDATCAVLFKLEHSVEVVTAFIEEIAIL